jgi:hypothetical protein
LLHDTENNSVNRTLFTHSSNRHKSACKTQKENVQKSKEKIVDYGRKEPTQFYDTDLYSFMAQYSQ